MPRSTPHQSASDLESHTGYWVRFVSNHVSHAFKRKVEARGVTVAEWAVMRQMFGAGPIHPSRIAEDLGMTRGAISKLIDRVVAKGLVQRTSDAEDGRYQTVSLTQSGRRLVPVLARLADQNDHEMFGHLPQGAQEELVRTLRTIVHHHGWKDVPVD